MSARGGQRNRLAGESSPYLLLHASNPVDWHPWGEEAFERARREDKPVFLSVGYSTCYWCHVMERESFSNDELAQQLNDGFVSIKLDREERPELDEIYMLATQLLTHQGGWPNSVFLTHDRKPFFAGTYFPPEDRYGRPGFPRVLEALRKAWDERREDVLEQAESLAEGIRGHLAAQEPSAGPPDAGVVAAVQAALEQRFDAQWGGFGTAPKFPSPSNLLFLLQRGEAGEARAKELLSVTLDRMARGGLQDQLAGGFHRYSTDARWLVPHFEKMLYDNAALARVYAHATGLLDEPEHARVARATLDFVQSEMLSPEGAFLSAIDAETDGHEGFYYTWTKDELKETLAPADFELLSAVYGFSGAPNFEDTRYVLHLPKPWSGQASARGWTVAALQAALEPGRQALKAVRDRRPRPLIDDKLMADWNGLMIAGFAEAGRRLDEPRYATLAAAAADFVLEKLRSSTGELLHSYRAGQAKIAAFLDDYAFLVQGLLALHEASGEPRWLESALRLQAEQDQRLWDEAGGGYFQAGEHPELLVRAKSATDGAMASGNGTAALNLLALAQRTGDGRFRERAERVFRAFAAAVEQFPLAHVTLVQALAEAGLEPQSESRRPRAQTALETQAERLVDVQAMLEPAVSGSRRRARVELQIAQGWHVNANPASDAELVPTQVAGPVHAVRYPPGETLAGPAPVAVYRGRVVLDVELLDPHPEPVELTVIFQPCDERRCLPSVTRRVTLVAPADV